MKTASIVRAARVDDRLIQEWTEVFRADPAARWSQSPGWVTSRRQLSHRPFDLWVVRDGNELTAAVPMRPDGSVYGYDASDASAPVFRDEDSAVVLADMAKNSAHVTRWLAVPDDSLWARQMPDDCIVDSEANLQLKLTGTFETYTQSLSKSLRYDVRRRNKFAIRVATAETIGRDVDQLISLHQARWRARGLPGLFFGQRGKFFRLWTRKAIETQAVELLVAESEGTPVGVACFMTHGGRTAFYQSGVAPIAGSPGTALVAEAISRAYARSDHTFDFLRGDEPYKRRWQPTREGAIHRYLLPGKSTISLRKSWWQAEANAFRKLRNRFEGKGMWS